MSDRLAAQVQRGLTRRGYKQDTTSSWQAEEPPFDTAPEAGPDPGGLHPSHWGRTADESRDLLRRQMCPVCGEGPWKSPLNHASRKHGIDRFTMREACGLTTVESVADPELSARFSARTPFTPEKAKAMSDERTRRAAARRWTSAGLAAVAQNVRAVSDDQRRAASKESKAPEAVARQSDAMRRYWASLTPEQRRARGQS